MSPFGGSARRAREVMIVIFSMHTDLSVKILLMNKKDDHVSIRSATRHDNNFSDVVHFSLSIQFFSYSSHPDNLLF